MLAFRGGFRIFSKGADKTFERFVNFFKSTKLIFLAFPMHKKTLFYPKVFAPRAIFEKKSGQKDVAPKSAPVYIYIYKQKQLWDVYVRVLRH